MDGCPDHCGTKLSKIEREFIRIDFMHLYKKCSTYKHHKPDHR